MTLRLTQSAQHALAVAHATFVGTPRQATYDRIVRTLTQLDTSDALFVLSYAVATRPPGLPSHLIAYHVVHEVQPAGPNVVITFALSKHDEDVTVTTITWG